jgi:hypothetical protein
MADFQRERLTGLIARREVVRAVMMRHTLHLMTADDYLRFRPAVQPAITRSFTGITSKRLSGVDIEPVLAAVRARFERGPATFAEVRAIVSEMEPDGDINALTYGARTFLPLVQVPGAGWWGYTGTAPYALAESFLERPLHGDGDPHELIRRYLAAFGPAAAKDVQAWSGLTGLKGAMKELDLLSLRDEGGDELFDLPGMPLPGDVPAPPRFLPDYDNVLLAYADRSRIVPEEHRKKVFLIGGRVRAAFLIDGFVAGRWKLEKPASLMIEPFGKLTKKDRRALEEEGERLARFLEPEADAAEVRFAP